MPLPFAVSVSHFVSTVGADAGFAAIVGLAVLVLLYFAHARETANLRDHAEQLSERIQELEFRLSSLARSVAAAAQPRPAASVAPGGGAVAAGAGRRLDVRSASAISDTRPLRMPIPAAPAGMAGPALAAATRFLPRPAPAPAPVASPLPAPEPPPAAVPLPVGASSGIGMPDEERLGRPATAVAAGVAAGAATGNGSGAGPALPSPSRAAGGAPPISASRRNAGAAPPAPRTATRAAAVAGARGEYLGGLSGRNAPRGRRGALPIFAGIGALIVVAVVVAVLLTSSSSTNHGGGTPHHAAATHPSRPVAPVATPSHVTVAVLNGTSVAGLAHRVAVRLVSAGYREGAVATASDQTHTATIVAYFPGARGEAIEVARQLRLGSASVQPVDAATQAVACPSAASCTAQVVVTVGTDLASSAPATATTG